MRSNEADDARPVIMVAWSDDDAADSALAWAARYARTVSGRLLLVTVAVPAVPIAIELPPAPISNAEVDRLSQQMREAAQRHGSSCTAHVAISTSVGAGLVRAAEEYGAEIICTGHSRGPIAQIVLGSVANHLVRASPVPVVVVRASQPR